MIITTQTAYGFTLLLLSSFIAGIMLSVLYLFLNLLPKIAMSCKAVSNGYMKFNESVKCQRVNTVFIASADFSICIIAACIICSLIFIFYGGQFRVASVAILCLGFFMSKNLLASPIASFITIISFVLIKTVLVIVSPAVLLIRIISRATGRIIGKCITRHKLSVMKKYSDEQFNKLQVLTEFGLVEQSYKELIK